MTRRKFPCRPLRDYSRRPRLQELGLACRYPPLRLCVQRSGMIPIVDLRTWDAGSRQRVLIYVSFIRMEIPGHVSPRHPLSLTHSLTRPLTAIAAGGRYHLPEKSLKNGSMANGVEVGTNNRKSRPPGRSWWHKSRHPCSGECAFIGQDSRLAEIRSSRISRSTKQ